VDFIMNNLIYIVPVVVIAIIIVIVMLNARRTMAKYQQNATADAAADTGDTLQASEKTPVQRRNIYEVMGVKQDDDHPLGAVQSVIRGRIRFIPTGLLFIAIGLLAIYILHFTTVDFYLERTPLNLLIATVLFIGAIVWGLQLMCISTKRIKLRRTGLEVTSIFGKKSFPYEDVDFYLTRTLEHRSDSNGYRPAFGRVGNYNYIWQCQLIILSTHKVIMFKSSTYAQLKGKLQSVMDAVKAPFNTQE